MRHVTSTIISCLLLSITSIQAQTIAPPQPPKITLQLNMGNMNDALVALGQAARVNFMMDATHLSTGAPPIRITSTASLEEHLDELDANQKLTRLPAKQLLLLWSAPDIRRLGQSILRGETINRIVPELPLGATEGSSAGEMNQPKAKQLSTEELLFRDVSNYFRDKQGWDGQTPGTVREVRVSDLPSDLHDRVVASAQTALLLPQAQMIWSAWFTNEFWNNAELKVVEENNGNPNGPRIPVLLVGGSIQTETMRGGSMISLGALKGVSKN